MSKDLSRTLQRTLTHLQPPPRKGGRFGAPIPSHFGSKPPFVQVKDRIPFWNFAPLDKVVLVKGGKAVKGLQGTLSRVDRESNRVWFKENEFGVKKRQQAQYPGEALTPSYSGGDAQAIYYQPRAYHVSNVRLQVKDGVKTYTTTRIRRSKVTWDRVQGRFHWNRYGLVPELVGREIEGCERHTGWVKIPWPKIEGDKTSKGENDVGAQESMKSTWVPTVEALEERRAHELSLPEREFGVGYHSRANRTKRYNERKAVGKGEQAMRNSLEKFTLGEEFSLDK